MRFPIVVVMVACPPGAAALISSDGRQQRVGAVQRCKLLLRLDGTIARKTMPRACEALVFKVLISERHSAVGEPLRCGVVKDRNVDEEPLCCGDERERKGQEPESKRPLACCSHLMSLVFVMKEKRRGGGEGESMNVCV